VTLASITAKDSYITLLGSQAAGVFEVVGYQRQTKAGGPINDLPLVQVFYDNVSQQRNASPIQGPKNVDITLKIEITVAGDAPVDLATLNNPGSTPAQRATALANAKEAAQNASELLESVWAKIWEITNDARNANLGLADNVVSNTWLDQFQRDEPAESGGFVIVTASAQLTFRIEETVLGDVGNQPDPAIYKHDIEVTQATDGTDDPVEETGVLVENP
jgi:hypothetical protein